MSGTNGRRIVAAFDARRQHPQTIERAVGLAAARRAELVALLIEDEDLLRLAGMPFAREVRAGSGGERGLDSATIARELKRYAERLHLQLTRAARQKQVSVSLQVVRGRFVRTALAVLADTDAVLFNVSGRAGPGLLAAGATADAQPLWVAFDATPSSRRVLTVAAELALFERRELRLLTAAGGGRGALQEAARHALAAQAAAGRVVSVGDATAVGLLGAVRGGGGLLLIGQDSPVLAGGGLLHLIDGATCPLALVR